MTTPEHRPIRALGLALIALCAAACNPVTAKPVASEPGAVAARCDRSDPANAADLFGWDPGSRAKLATLAAEGVVVVRYRRDGCDLALDVLSRCTSRKAYYLYERRPAEERRDARTVGELWERFPIAAPRVMPRMTAGTELRAEWVQAGVERLPPGTRVTPGELTGDCEGATHIVLSIARGAFVLASGKAEAFSADGSLLRAAERSRAQVADRAGDIRACASAGGDLVPGCDVPLRVTLTPLGELAGEEAPVLADCPVGMAAIPAGQFKMGCQQGEPEERPVHAVGLSAFCLGVTEVTVGEYAACVRAGKCASVEDRGASAATCHPVGSPSLDHPQSCVAREQAARYCAWVGGRLPTEAEWEYAARFGAENWAYPIGLTHPSPEEACIGRRAPCAVRSFRPEAFGLHDMTGNLHEWVSDDYAEYTLQSRTDARGTLSGIRAVARGGSFSESYDNLRSTRRHLDMPGPSPRIGFRCARSR